MSTPRMLTLTLGAVGLGWAARHVTAPAVRGWRPGTGHTRRAGRLQVRTFGAGEPVVVLLHGMVAAGNFFGAGFDPLGVHGTVVVPDLLGFGGSPVPPGPLTAADHLAALTEMINELGLSGHPIVAAGHSMGSVLALRWAAQHIEQVRGVVAFCPPLYRTGSEADARVRKMGRMEAFLAGDGHLSRAICDWMCHHRTVASWLAVAARPDLPVAVARAAVKHTWDTYRGSFVDVLRSAAWEPALQHLRDATVPVTLVEGARDPVPVPGRAAELAAAIPSAAHRVHPSAGHYLPLTAASWCAAQIAAQIDTAGWR